MAMRFDAGEIITAMITPMDKDRKVDYKALEKLVEHLIATGEYSCCRYNRRISYADSR